MAFALGDLFDASYCTATPLHTSTESWDGIEDKLVHSMIPAI